jgi:hypothetical protein
MAYTQEGIMAQVSIAFGQGTGAVRVSQEAALELRRWYWNAITPEVIDTEWALWSLQVLDRIRAIGSLAALKATQAGSPTISAQQVYESAVAVQLLSDTSLCPPIPPPL